MLFHYRPETSRLLSCVWLQREESNLHFLINSQARYRYATPQSWWSVRGSNPRCGTAGPVSSR